MFQCALCIVIYRQTNLLWLVYIRPGPLIDGKFKFTRHFNAVGVSERMIYKPASVGKRVIKNRFFF